VSGIAYTAGVAIVDEGSGAVSSDIQSVDWFESDGTNDRFLIRAKAAPYAYRFAAPSGGTSFTLKAIATDFSNNTSDLASFTWNVVPNDPPAHLNVAVTPAAAYLASRLQATISFEDEGLAATVGLKVTGSHTDGSPYELPPSRITPSANQQANRSAVDAAWPPVAFTIDLPPDLEEGEPLHVTATVIDSVNQSASATTDVPLLPDTAAPRIVSMTPAPETHFQFGNQYRITLRATDDESGIAHVTFSWDNQPPVDVTAGSVDPSTGVFMFSTDVAVTAKNTDTRVHIAATAYDFHGNGSLATVDVIYDSVNDGTIPVAQWLTPLDGSALPAGQMRDVKLRIRATDDVHVEAVQFQSDAFAAPLPPVSAPSAGSIYEETATVNVPPSGSFTVTATVSDADPAHDVVLPIVIDAVPIDHQILGDFALTASNAPQFQNASLLVSGSGTHLYVTVPVTLRDLVVLDGAIVGNPDRVKLDITSMDHLYVDDESALDVTAKGNLGGWALSEDGVTRNNDARGMSPEAGPLEASGSYGGLGGGAVPNAPYGSLTEPSDFGTGGAGGATCCSAGANGGGAILLHGDRVVIAGSLRADGGSGVGAQYAGSGGSIAVAAHVLVSGPATRITANGGDDEGVANGDAGGGGGRISITATDRLDLFDAASELQSRGGRNGTSAEGRTYLDAGAGTILLRRPGVASGELRIASTDERFVSTSHQTRATPLAGMLAFDAVTVGPRTLVRVDGNLASPMMAIDPTAILLLPADVPSLDLTTTPAAGSTLIQGTTLAASFTTASPAGIGDVTLTLAAPLRSTFSDYPVEIAAAPASVPVPPDLPPGAVTLHAIATDRAGRAAEISRDFTVVANAPPQFTRFDVLPRQTYAGHTIVASVTASDDLGITTLTLASSAGTISASPATADGPSTSQTFSIDLPPNLTGGSIVQLTATADDGFPGRVPVAQTETVDVLNDSNPPSVTITSPAPNATFEVGSLVRIPIRVTAIDAEVGVTRAWASIDGGPAMEMTPDGSASGGWMADVPVPQVDGFDPVDATIAVFAADFQNNQGQGTVPIVIKPVIDPNGPAVSFVCPSAGALYPPGYSARVHVNAVPASLDNDVTSVDLYVGDAAVPVAAVAIGNDVWEATITMPAGAEGDEVPLKAVATSIRNNVNSFQRTVRIAVGAVIVSDTTIDAANAAFDGGTLIVAGGTTTIEGHHSFSRLIILDGATVTHPPLGRLDLDVAGATYVSCSGSIDATGRGEQDAGIETIIGAGGSHGGEGAPATGGTAPAFGSVFDPKEAGGVGAQTSGCAPCDGPGGGIIRLRSGDVTVDGTIRANGAANQAAGAGGSVRIDANAISGSGQILAAIPSVVRICPFSRDCVRIDANAISGKRTNSYDRWYRRALRRRRAYCPLFRVADPSAGRHPHDRRIAGNDLPQIIGTAVRGSRLRQRRSPAPRQNRTDRCRNPHDDLLDREQRYGFCRAIAGAGRSRRNRSDLRHRHIGELADRGE
ncbi:MAG TPA: Ig-like domain-containing protein, partial [Thermoanaerobaculia bacterium]|nr:Ig-like domain-containing protein [Thermoanaerobaculia bacterium]